MFVFICFVEKRANFRQQQSHRNANADEETRSTILIGTDDFHGGHATEKRHRKIGTVFESTADQAIRCLFQTKQEESETADPLIQNLFRKSINVLLVKVNDENWFYSWDIAFLVFYVLVRRGCSTLKRYLVNAFF